MRAVYYEIYDKNGELGMGTKIKCDGKDLDFTEIHRIKVIMPDGDVEYFTEFEPYTETVDGIFYNGFIVTIYPWGAYHLKSWNLYMENCELYIE